MAKNNDAKINLEYALKTALSGVKEVENRERNQFVVDLDILKEAIIGLKDIHWFMDNPPVEMIISLIDQLQAIYKKKIKE